MFDVAASLQGGLNTARNRLDAAQHALVQANASPGGRAVDSAMAHLAQASLFQEALLGSIHARLAEIKSVTK